MNAHIRALAVKFMITFAVTGLLLYYTDITFSRALTISLVLTIVTYLAADLPFLPVLGSFATVFADIILTVPVLWGLTRFYAGVPLSSPVLIITAAAVAAGELLFHLYTASVVLNKNR